MNRMSKSRVEMNESCAITKKKKESYKLNKMHLLFSLDVFYVVFKSTFHFIALYENLFETQRTLRATI